MSTLRATNIKNPDSGSNNIVLDGSGGVVISGVTTVSAGSTSLPSISPSGDENTGVFFPSADTIAFAEGGTEVARFDSSGRLSIGTASASSPLHVQVSRTSSTSAVALTLSDDVTGSQTNGVYKAIRSTSNSSVSVSEIRFVETDGTNNNTGIAFATQSTAAALTERARIDNNGRLLVGTTAARSNFGPTGVAPTVQIEDANNTGNYGLSVINNYVGAPGRVQIGASYGTTIGSNVRVDYPEQYGLISFVANDGTSFLEGARIAAWTDAATGSGDMPSRLVFSTTADGASSPTERMRIDNTGASAMYTANTGTTLLNLQHAATAGTTAAFITGTYSATGVLTGTVSLRIWSNGNIVNTNNSYGSLSDAKLKENIVDANSQWDDLKDLRVVNYNFKEGQTHTQIGLIAQEVELVSPGLVSESPDRDEEGNDLGTTTKSVNYSVLYMKAVKALQEAMERIETLETSNNDLAARVAALEGN